MQKKRILQMTALTGGLAIVGGILAWLATHGIGLFCVWYQLTDLRCPGCGNTRAAVSLLRGDIGGMFSYNLLFLLEAGYIAWVYFGAVFQYVKNGKFSYRTPTIWLDITVLSVVLLWGIVRNILHI